MPLLCLPSTTRRQFDQSTFLLSPNQNPSGRLLPPLPITVSSSPLYRHRRHHPLSPNRNPRGLNPSPSYHNAASNIDVDSLSSTSTPTPLNAATNIDADPLHTGADSLHTVATRLCTTAILPLDVAAFFSCRMLPCQQPRPHLTRKKFMRDDAYYMFDEMFQRGC